MALHTRKFRSFLIEHVVRLHDLQATGFIYEDLREYFVCKVFTIVDSYPRARILLLVRQLVISFFPSQGKRL